MQMTVSQQREYVLGHGDAELRRLDAQGDILAPGSRMILAAAGVRSGMRVLDLGTGTGEVALLAAQLVGPSGYVLGVDISPQALDHAARKARDWGSANVEFRQADVADFRPEPGYDAIVGRLVLPYLPDALAALTTWFDALAPGGVVIAMEYDLAAAHTDPPTPLFGLCLRRIAAAFNRAGTGQQLGPRLAGLLAAAGGADPQVMGMTRYLGPDDPRGPSLVHRVTASLLPTMVQRGIATAEQVEIDTLEQRLCQELIAFDAVVSPPTLVGAWARRR
jgi:SAM-dependent methyltransferase